VWAPTYAPRDSCASPKGLPSESLQIAHASPEAVEGRPPSTIDVSEVEGTVACYCLAEWTQEGMSAEYTFLYRV
jgi:hypothetical protein